MRHEHKVNHAAVLIIALLCALFMTHAIGASTGKVKLPTSLNQQADSSDELLIFLEPGTTIASFEAKYALTHKQTLKSDPNAHIFVADNTVQALSTRRLAAQDRTVRQVYENRRTHKVRHAFVPDDPYFHKETPAPWTGRGQWHLTNEYTDVDSNVSGAWAQDITGMGVTIGIVDDGLETTHEDLAPNYVASNSWDFGAGDAVPDPVYSNDSHGTSVAGVAAARGGNAIGVTGAAPYANLAGLRIDFDNQTVAMFVDATLYHSSSGSTAIAVKNHSYGFEGTYGEAIAENAALSTSVEAGTLHLFSAGNDRGLRDPDSNKKQPQNNPDCITVAALGFDGVFSEYSCFGANVVVTAPSSDVFANFTEKITTTDQTGSLGYNSSSGDTFTNDLAYTTLFGGTSSAAPLMAGILALGREAQPLLNTRFAKHILARTCRMVDPLDATAESDGGWRTNAAGFKFNQNYGFGLIDGAAFVDVARQYTGVTDTAVEAIPTTPVIEAIPDFSFAGVTRTFNLTSNTPLEEITVTMDITHPYNTDIEITLTGPDGYSSRLAKRSGFIPDFADINWSFCTHAFWGCNPQGTWTLKVTDLGELDTGTWNSFGVTARMGTLLNGPPAFVDLSEPVPGNTVLHWRSLPDELYTLSYSSNLLSGFSSMASNIPATPFINTYTDTVHNADSQFWKLTVEP